MMHARFQPGRRRPRADAFGAASLATTWRSTDLTSTVPAGLSPRGEVGRWARAGAALRRPRPLASGQAPAGSDEGGAPVREGVAHRPAGRFLTTRESGCVC